MKNITLKKVKLLDIKIIYNLFNEAVEDNFFKTKKKITFEDHKKWFLTNYKSSKTKILLCILNSRKIGYIKFNIIGLNSAKASIILSKKFRKKKLGTEFLRKGSKICYNKFGVSSIYAEVLKKNKHSKYFFLKNGYKMVKFKKKFKGEFEKGNYIFFKNLN